MSGWADDEVVVTCIRFDGSSFPFFRTICLVSWGWSSVLGFYSDPLLNKSQRQHFCIWVLRKTRLWNYSVLLCVKTVSCEMLTGPKLSFWIPEVSFLISSLQNLGGQRVLAFWWSVFLHLIFFFNVTVQHCAFSYLILTITLWRRDYYPCLIDEDDYRD